jgi:hypothetical protein
MFIGFVYTLDNSHKPNYHCSDTRYRVYKKGNPNLACYRILRSPIYFFHTNKDQGPVVSE